MSTETNAGRGVPPVGSIARRTTNGEMHVWQHRAVRPPRVNVYAEQDATMILENLRREQMEAMNSEITSGNRINARIALDSYQRILSRYSQGQEFSMQSNQVFGVELDSKATRSYRSRLSAEDGVTEVIETEGAKERHKFGIVLPLIKGLYGKDKASVLPGQPRKQIVLDPVECTGRASRNEDGSFVLRAGSLKGGLPKIPTGEGLAHHMDRTVGPARVKGLVSVGSKPKENFEVLIDTYKLSKKSDVHIHLLGGRDRNQEEEKGYREAGATIWLHPDGDVAPALYAMTHDEPVLSVGSGGMPEGAAVMYGAKALGAAFDMQWVDRDGNPVDEQPGIWTPDDLPGSADDYFLSIASITGVPELNLPRPIKAADDSDRYYNIPVAYINSRAPYLQTELIPLVTRKI